MPPYWVKKHFIPFPPLFCLECMSCTAPFITFTLPMKSQSKGVSLHGECSEWLGTIWTDHIPKYRHLLFHTLPSLKNVQLKCATFKNVRRNKCHCDELLASSVCQQKGGTSNCQHECSSSCAFTGLQTSFRGKLWVALIGCVLALSFRNKIW